jgi:murein DD-endopeptidase MepM/ murein hydrolase activator NlpD
MRLPIVRLGLLLSGLMLMLGSEGAQAKISLSNDSPAQGQTIEVNFLPDKANLDKASGDSAPTPYTLSFNKSSYRLFPVTVTSADTGFRCLVAIPADLPKGDYQLSIKNDQPVEERAIKIQDGKFPVQRLTLPKSKDNFVMAPGEKEAVEQAKALLSDKRLWQGNFKLPSKFRQSAAFGMKRIVNGRLLKDYFHSGLDFAASLGTPVDACADGKVILAHKGYKLHGNIVAIDHGQGVVSFYIHLQQILVQEGDMVKAGEKIATVGQTGRANGPHLHFSIYVNKIATNPSQWFNTTF